MAGTEVDISVGTILSIAVGAPATYDTAGFAAKTYTEVGEITEIPPFGGSGTVTENIPLKTGVVGKNIGSINYGSMEIPFAKVDDAGQAAVSAAFDGANGRSTHSFKIVDPNGDAIYFTGKVSANTLNFGDANAVYMGSFTVELTNQPIQTGDITVYNLIYAAGANGSIIGPTNQIIASGEDGVAVYAAPDSGFVFIQWSDTSTDNPRQDTSVAADVSVTATFVSA